MGDTIIGGMQQPCDTCGDHVAHLLDHMGTTSERQRELKETLWDPAIPN